MHSLNEQLVQTVNSIWIPFLNDEGNRLYRSMLTNEFNISKNMDIDTRHRAENALQTLDLQVIVIYEHGSQWHMTMYGHIPNGALRVSLREALCAYVGGPMFSTANTSKALAALFSRQAASLLG